MEGPWTRSETSASGQVFEFRLWALLTEQSRGQLHVFLPLTDRGIDGLVHRVSDGTYLAVQAKSRSTLQDGEVHIVVWADSLVDDEILIVSSLIVDGGLGPTCLVIPVIDFKRLANRSSNDGVPILFGGVRHAARGRTADGFRGWFRPNVLLNGSGLRWRRQRRPRANLARNGGAIWAFWVKPRSRVDWPRLET